ncbi:MAG: arylsulfatase [Cyclobacteriaceae bacterium]|nr:arylsulfatase [Cyclobacteriaceae bacterium]
MKILYLCLKIIFFYCGLFLCGCQHINTDQTLNIKPNVIIIITDDQGWGDLSLHGNPNIHTPNIDKMAADGVQFENFYVQPVCSPTRAEMLTGRYALRCGVYSTSEGGERINADEKTLAEYFKEASYATSLYGKWHSGMQPPYHPNSRGFDDFYGFCSGHWGDYLDADLEHNGIIVQGKGFMPDDLTQRTIDFVKSNKDQAFFSILSFNTPHSPMQMPDELWDTVKDRKLDSLYTGIQTENLDFTRAAIAFCENIDWNIGRLMLALEEEDLTQNTLVIFLSDNGPNSWRWNGGMKGRKGSTDEGGVRVPFIMHWPAVLNEEKTISEVASVTDLLPTLMDLIGSDASIPKPLDGKSLKPLLLTDKAATWEDRMLINHWNGQTSVRNQHFRLDHEGKLYNMQLDPAQQFDVSSKYNSIRTAMLDVKKAFELIVLAELPETDDRPFTLGAPGAVYTHFPARDAEASGSIHRSNQWPNCSFYTNWREVRDSIYWNTEVLEEGLFKVMVYYTCAEENAGTKLELQFNASRLEFVVNEPHDPPLQGMEYDRIPREESYVKDFITLNAGEIFLEKGRGILSLKALDIPGNLSIDFRQIVFERLN